ncbi:hypothetical protein ACJIZ3_011421 [Penstemon smallii]|uniref:DAGKc domain-containing protein n=1 Tax=Penstemon smallii TaxID=265156 RepID=A0ABD3UJ17_9LAMI
MMNHYFNLVNKKMLKKMRSIVMQVGEKGLIEDGRTYGLPIEVDRCIFVLTGGDGTFGWVLGCLGELKKHGRLPIPPTKIVPLCT